MNGGVSAVILPSRSSNVGLAASGKSNRRGLRTSRKQPVNIAKPVQTTQHPRSPELTVDTQGSVAATVVNRNKGIFQRWEGTNFRLAAGGEGE